MIDRSLLKEHLALDRRTITELATGISAIAVIGATLYNLGFFAPIEWSLISLLTVQDMLVGAVIAAVPTTAAAWVAIVIGRLIRSAPETRLLTLAIGIPALAVAGVGFAVFLNGPLQWTFGHLACGYLLLGLLTAGLNIQLRSRRLPRVLNRAGLGTEDGPEHYDVIIDIVGGPDVSAFFHGSGQTVEWSWSVPWGASRRMISPRPCFRPSRSPCPSQHSARIPCRTLNEMP